MSKPMSKIIVGKIYADWCTHCQDLAPEWDKLKSKVGGSVEFKDISDDKMEELDALNKQLNLSEPIKHNGYPTIYKVVDGKVSYYGGVRTMSAIKNWIENKVQPLNRTFTGGKKTQKKRHNKNKTHKSKKGILSSITRFFKK